ncbi:hypothetical protein K470DRAFT_211313 [Piedraia hortae CBS 480.64]|uniref:Microbial-type PARG catalytic domain-containing protein n=1 Tax=Piedraia hortae CBS 480.64 TaxID=1314780 RepID=A0A6A7C7K0_9PEZI|nr:hypothetical protein K470DRAFT_211313 [Piedraia hortae CBS 480.64]
MPLHRNRRDERAQRAKETITRTVPDVLRTSRRATDGLKNAELIANPEAMPSCARAPPTIRLSSFDTLTAAARLRRRTDSTTAVLNMASEQRPGGGFLDGGNGQEEFLCQRTTLYSSLRGSFYPLPEVGGVWTPDVLVFRDAAANPLPERERFFVNVITAGTFRFPDARRRSDTGFGNACSCGMSYCDRDRELVMRKMKAVMRMAESKNATTLVLGAWGCGSYGNPALDVAKIWRKVIVGGPRQRRPNAEQWLSIQEIVFAIPDPSMMREFHRVFDDIAVADGPSEAADDHERLTELLLRVQETEQQMEHMSNSRGRARLRTALAELQQQLMLGRAAQATNDDVPLERETDDFIVADVPASDDESELVHVMYDSDSSQDAVVSPTYEFRPPPPGLASHDEEDVEAFDMDAVGGDRFDATTGWFSGSIDEFHGLLKGAPGKFSYDSHTPFNDDAVTVDEVVSLSRVLSGVPASD